MIVTLARNCLKRKLLLQKSKRIQTFFQICKKFSICKTDIGPLLNCSTNSLINDKSEMCCLLVDQFTGVFTTPDPNHIVTDPVSFFAHEHITDINQKMFLTDIELNEDIIIEAIHELFPNSAAGPDCVPSSLLTNCATELAPVLLLIFSHSLTHGVIPDSWKRAAVIPIYKSGDNTVPSNYRPISVICKVLERIIRKQICSFLDQNGCFNSTQHGFRSGRSCLSALLDVFDNIMHMLDNNPSVDMVYLDFSKAFDKVYQTTQPTSGGAVTVVSSCCANCVEPPRPRQWVPDLPFLGHADPLDGWRCCSQKRVMSRPIQVRQL